MNYKMLVYQLKIIKEIMETLKKGKGDSTNMLQQPEITI